ncbi:hypothetical protein [uncultured Tenacibaculum sp.]|uniref:hypothetical protein n=1 Tax=uncultured Tenacibaculum sp. TaxID=174713 RepID=UPI00260ABBED|nr:hypothetical protein [uncultured Tenacibaculum sp.]
MESSTILNIASFSINMINKPSGNPMDAVVQMLNSINSKINILNEKMDLIINEITTVDDRVETKRRVNDLIAVYEQSRIYLNNYNDYIENYKYGRKKFIEDHKFSINQHLQDITNSFNVLKSNHEPYIISQICLSIILYSNLSHLVDTNNIKVKNQFDAFLKYLKQVLYTSGSSIEKIINRLENEVNELLTEEWAELKYNYYRAGSGRQRGVGRNGQAYLRTPTFELKETSVEEKELISFFYSEGYISNEDWFYQFVKLNSKKIDLNVYKNHKNKCQTHIVKPGIPIQRKTSHCKFNNVKRFKSKLNDSFKQLFLYYSCQYSTSNVLKETIKNYQKL